MGHSIAIRCNRCSYSTMVMVGISFQEFCYPGVLNDLHPLASQELKAIAANDSSQLQGHIHHRHFYQCQDCSHIFDDLVVSVLQEGKLRFLDHWCEKCNGPAASLDKEEVMNYNCPECKEKSLFIDKDAPRILWD